MYPSLDTIKPVPNPKLVAPSSKKMVLPLLFSFEIHTTELLTLSIKLAISSDA